ncbi:FIG033376: Heat shock protein DnaJ-like [invertebrate metagenome]|uniref:FIG033376: Heat shock protein DnaJ-like n=1 Tax=invertebrate metagenome TaxID=1711999 RepID=A0A484H5D1_9ZZZZ
MLPVLLFGLIVLMAVVLLLRWFTTSEPRDVLRGLKWSGLAVVAVVAVLLAANGRLGWLFAVLAAWIPRLMRTLQIHALIRGVWTALTSAGFHSVSGAERTARASVIETECLRMVLDHTSGHLSGRVRTGSLAGRLLDDLSLAELMVLYRFCATDENSLQVLEAWLDREGPAGWRQTTSAFRKDDSADHVSTGSMTHAEALRVLDLESDATPDQIREAYCRLITRLHPDHGGSSYLAAQLNCAKDVLLGS